MFPSLFLEYPASDTHTHTQIPTKKSCEQPLLPDYHPERSSTNAVMLLPAPGCDASSRGGINITAAFLRSFGTQTDEDPAIQKAAQEHSKLLEELASLCTLLQANCDNKHVLKRIARDNPTVRKHASKQLPQQQQPEKKKRKKHHHHAAKGVMDLLVGKHPKPAFYAATPKNGL